MTVHDVQRAGHGKGCDRQSGRGGLQQHHAEGVGLAGKDEDVGAGVVPGQLLSVFHPCEDRVGIAALKVLQHRAVADHHLGADRQVELQEGFDVFLDRDAADVEVDGFRQVQSRILARPEQLGIDAARPLAHVGEAALLQLPLEAGRRHHDTAGGTMEAAHRAVAPGGRDRQARRDVFGKARVVAGREGDPPAQTVAPRRPAKGPLGGDVDRFGAIGVEFGAELAGGQDRETDLRIGGAGEGAEKIG